MVALVRGVHGLRGAVRVEVLTDHPERRFVAGAVLHREGREERLTIASAEAVADGPGWRLRFREIASREAADQLRGTYLEAVVLPELELGRGEYYWHEIIGVTVRGVDGTDLGTVRDIYRVGENEVFEVEGGTVAPFDLPAVRAFIRVFAPRRGEIVVDAEALDLRPAKARPAAGERPRAPRRTAPHRRVAAAGPTDAATPPAADPWAGLTADAPGAAEPEAADAETPVTSEAPPTDDA